MPLLFYYPFALTPLLFYYPFIVFTGMVEVAQEAMCNPGNRYLGSIQQTALRRARDVLRDVLADESACAEDRAKARV
jgi:hypothetical protein